MTTRPFPWTATVPNSGPKSGECGCDPPPMVNRLFTRKFGPDTAEYWAKIPRSFAPRFVTIGAQSEWDCCILEGAACGPLVVAVGAPCIIPIDTDITVRPYRTAGYNSDSISLGTLDLIITNEVPGWALSKRAPRVYPEFESATLSSATETLMMLNTQFVNAAVKGIQAHVVVAGAKSFSLYLNNGEASDIDFRHVGVANLQSFNYPISPSTYTTAAPTYTTLPAGSSQSYHFSLDDNAFDSVLLYAKGTADNLTLTHSCEVRD